MLNKVFDVIGGQIRVFYGKINAARLEGRTAQDFFDYTDSEVNKETLAKIAERGNTTDQPLQIGEGTNDTNAATLRQVRFEAGEALNAARTEINSLRGSGAMTHDTLKKASEAIDTLLAIVQSDDVNLDTVKEIVAFIKNNKDVIDTIATQKLDKSTHNAFVEQMGSELQALASSINGKAAANHTHTPAEVGAAASNHSHDEYCSTSDHRLTNDRTAANLRNVNSGNTVSVWIGTEAEYNQQQPNGLAFIL